MEKEIKQDITKELVDALKNLLPENQDPAIGEPSMAAVERARKAIAKATGQEYESFDDYDRKYAEFWRFTVETYAEIIGKRNG